MPPDWQAEWAPLIRRFRQTQGLKQNAFAAMLGVNQTTVSRWEAGSSIPDLPMQRRLRDLLWKSSPNDALLKHRALTSLHPTILSVRGWILVASRPYAVDHGITQDDAVGRSAMPTMDEDGMKAWWAADKLGFYRGEVASVTLVAQWHSLSGHSHGQRYGKSVWTPVRLTSNGVIRYTQRVTLTEEQYHRERAAIGGATRIVMMDELCR